MARDNETGGAGDVFEGSNHVLRGLEQQLGFWQGLEGHAAQKQHMIAALGEAAALLRDALQQAKVMPGR